MTHSLIQEAIEAAATQDLCGNHNSADLLRRLARELEAERGSHGHWFGNAQILLANLEWLAEISGEWPEDEDGVMVKQVRIEIAAHAKRREAGE